MTKQSRELKAVLERIVASGEQARSKTLRSKWGELRVEESEKGRT